MAFKPSPIQALYIWRLITLGGENWLKEMKPGLDKKAREELVGNGLIETEKRKDVRTKRQANIVILTDKGWAWAAENMDAEISKRSTYSGPVLQDLLAKLRDFMARRNVPLAEIITAPSTSSPKSQAIKVLSSEIDLMELEKRIVDAYSLISGGIWNTRVRLADLRNVLKDFSRETVDQVIDRMEREGKLILFTLENPREIRPEDETAALVISGIKRHVVYMER